MKAMRIPTRDSYEEVAVSDGREYKVGFGGPYMS
jgi:hypothetical protein